MRWGDRETSIFVNLYLRNDILWNTENPDYKSKCKRLPAYKRIVEGFHAATGITLNVMEVKMKIKSLRSTYCQELVKIRDRSEGGFNYKPSLKWFEQWHKRFEKINNSVSDTSEYVETEDVSGHNLHDDNYDDTMTKSDPFASHSDDGYLVVLKPEPQPDEESNEDDHTDREHHIEIPSMTKKKRVILSSNVNRRNRIHSISLDALTSLKEDEFDIYGKYIATQLRSLDLEKALKVQLQIQNIVSEARLSKR